MAEDGSNLDHDVCTDVAAPNCTQQSTSCIRRACNTRNGTSKGTRKNHSFDSDSNCTCTRHRNIITNAIWLWTAHVVFLVGKAVNFPQLVWALEEEELGQKVNHQGVQQVKTDDISVLTITHWRDNLDRETWHPRSRR